MNRAPKPLDLIVLFLVVRVRRVVERRGLPTFLALLVDRVLRALRDFLGLVVRGGLVRVVLTGRRAVFLGMALVYTL